MSQLIPKGIELFNARTYKFGELSTASQLHAIKHFVEGWIEAHPGETITMDDALEVLAYDFENDFDINGNYQGES